MNTTTLREKREFLALAGLSFILLFCGIYATRSYVMDDALITLRYSFNLARHGHAIWNQADVAHPSLGYTTVGWMLINAVPAFFTDNKDCLVLVCKLIGLVPLVAIALLFVGQISGMPVPRPFRIAVVLAIFSQVLYGFHLNSGMETLLFSCLILLTVRSYAQANGGGTRNEERGLLEERGTRNEERATAKSKPGRWLTWPCLVPRPSYLKKPSPLLPRCWPTPSAHSPF
jgi:hypothetical protein